MKFLPKIEMFSQETVFLSGKTPVNDIFLFKHHILNPLWTEVMDVLVDEYPDLVSFAQRAPDDDPSLLAEAKPPFFYVFKKNTYDSCIKNPKNRLLHSPPLIVNEPIAGHASRGIDFRQEQNPLAWKGGGSMR